MLFTRATLILPAIQAMLTDQDAISKAKIKLILISWNAFSNMNGQAQGHQTKELLMVSLTLSMMCILIQLQPAGDAFQGLQLV